MKLIKTIKTLKSQAGKIKKQNKIIGLVPTMGYLHQGHLSLIRKACKECDIVVISIFINPTQFGAKEDFSKYPQNLKRDLALAKSENVDIVFMPHAALMYAKGYQTYVDVENLSKGLCGMSRPGHFKGVATIVAKLLNIVNPDIVYFGQKDAQQAIIIDRMIKDLDIDVKLKTSPIVREKDGLAMSSRNKYLSKIERRKAVGLYKSLIHAKTIIKTGVKNTNIIRQTIKNMIKSIPDAKIDYISIVDLKELKPVKRLNGEILIALAVYFGKIRLIDNIIMKGL